MELVQPLGAISPGMNFPIAAYVRVLVLILVLKGVYVLSLCSSVPVHGAGQSDRSLAT